jgi:hypothetical protein
MVLIQIYIPYTANNTYFDVPLYGVYDLNVVSIQFHDSGANTQFRVVEIQSYITISIFKPSILDFYK